MNYDDMKRWFEDYPLLQILFFIIIGMYIGVKFYAKIKEVWEWANG
jgi:hypothetical protein